MRCYHQLPNNGHQFLSERIIEIGLFQLEVYYKADRLLTGLTAQQKGTTARWYSNKTSLTFQKENRKILSLVLSKMCAIEKQNNRILKQIKQLQRETEYDVNERVSS